MNAARFTATASTLILAECSALRRQVCTSKHPEMAGYKYQVKRGREVEGWSPFDGPVALSALPVPVCKKLAFARVPVVDFFFCSAFLLPGQTPF